MAIQLLRLSECPALKEAAAQWFHEKWDVPVEAYLESMEESLAPQGAVPIWYVVLDGAQIIAGAGVIAHDFHDREDLTPNVVALYTEDSWRGQGIAGMLLKTMCDDMAEQGIDTLYLITEHTSFYERYGWAFLCMAHEVPDGQPIRLYVHHNER